LNNRGIADIPDLIASVIEPCVQCWVRHRLA
jgi:hypothetical protein